MLFRSYKVCFENYVFDCVDRGYGKEEEVDVVIRPEDLKIINKENAPIIGEVSSIIFKGVHYEICVMVNGKEYVIHTTKEATVGDIVGLTVEPNDIHVMEVGVPSNE